MEEDKINTQPTQEEQLEENPFKEGVEVVAVALLKLIHENRALRKVNENNEKIISRQEEMLEAHKGVEAILQETITMLRKKLEDLKYDC